MNHNFLLNTGIHESTHNQIIKKKFKLTAASAVTKVIS